MLKYGIQEKKAIEFLTRDPYGVENKLAHLRANLGSINSPSGWLITALKQNWQFPVAVHNDLRVGENNTKSITLSPDVEALYMQYLVECEAKIKQETPEKYAEFEVWIQKDREFKDRIPTEDERLLSLIVYFVHISPIETAQILSVEEWLKMQAKSHLPGLNFAR